MPSNLPSSFASAAAGQNTNRDARSNSQSNTRGASGDWNRRDGRPSNGTVTFRRSSTTPSLAAQAAQATEDQVPPTPDVPPSVPTDYNAVAYNLSAYSRDQLLEICKSQAIPEDMQQDVSRLFASGWNPGHTSNGGGGAQTRWSKSTDHHAPQEPDLCWDSSGTVNPVGLKDMSHEERDLFSQDVNSTMKPPQPRDPKDGGLLSAGLNGRKASLSHGTSPYGGLNSPMSASRPGARRRETTDTNLYAVGGLASPSVSRYPRDDAPWFTRSRTDAKETPTLEEAPDDDAQQQVESSLRSLSLSGGGGFQQQQQQQQQQQPTPAQPSKSSFPFGTLGRSNTAGALAGGGAGGGGAGGGGAGGLPGLAGVGAGGALPSASTAIWGATASGAGGGPTSSSASIAASASQSAMGSFGNFALPTTSIADKPQFARSESRFANIMPTKESSENVRQDAASADPNRSWRPRPRTDTDPFGSEDALGPLGRGREASPPPPMPQGASMYDTPAKATAGDFGMSGLNLGSVGMGGAGMDDYMPLSPSETNPYRSPAGAERHGAGEEEVSAEKGDPSAFGTLPRGFNPGGFEGSDRSQTSSAGPSKGFGAAFGASGWPSGPAVGTPDRERQFSAFGGGVFAPTMGEMHSPSVGAAIGGGVFGAPGSMSATGSIRGMSKLGSLLPAAMQSQGQPGQEQMQQEGSLTDSVSDLRHGNPMGSIGRGSAFGRDGGSPMRAARGAFEGLFDPELAKQAPIGTQPPGPPGGTSTTEAAVTPAAPPGDTPPNQVRQMVMPDRMRWVYLDPQQQTQGPFTGLEMNDWYKGNFFSPDLRIKKVEDPEFEPLGHLIRRIGNSREPFLVPQVGIPHGRPGPFPPNTGAVVPPLPNAFPQYGRVLPADEQNNLERRKQEEQLKMARQRDYFAQQQAMTKMSMGNISGSLHHHSSAHSLQSQPSFGSISSPVGLSGQPQAPIGAGIPTGATGATTSATATTSDFFGGTPQGLFDESTGQQQQLRQPPGVGSLGPDPNLQHTQSQLQLQHQMAAMEQMDTSLLSQLPRTDQLEADDLGFSARLRQFEQLRQHVDSDEGTSAQQVAMMAAAMAASNVTSSVGVGGLMVQRSIEDADAESKMSATPIPPTIIPTSESIPLSQRKAPDVAPEAMEHGQPEVEDEHGDVYQHEHEDEYEEELHEEQQQPSAWDSVKTPGMPMPFPPPPGQSSTPLPAPTAQRNRSTLPEQYANRSQSQTPDNGAPLSATQPPPLAPWARETAETHHKGPSLKEIQAAESRKAAKAEKVAVQARRAAVEQEAVAAREKEKAAAANQALSTSSTWGNTASPVGGTSAAATAPAPISAWSKPGAVKGALSGMMGESKPSKKTLADIQREEELRKKKEMATQSNVGGAGGKRYADLASKTGQAQPGLGAAAATAAAGPGVAAGWTTVAAGGKAKIPTGPSAQTRSVSAVVKSGSMASMLKSGGSGVAKSSMPSMSAVAAAGSASKETGLKTTAAGTGVAMDEFKKWVDRELKRGMPGGIDVRDFASTLLSMPLEQDLIADVVYTGSQTMDGRHFAEEFIRRRKLADRGIVEKAAPVAESAKNAPGGGWNEVAKKGGHGKGEASATPEPIQSAASFKVVSRKKGKK